MTHPPTVSRLAYMLRRKQARLKKLVANRDALLDALREVDLQIAAVKSGRALREQKPLQRVIIEVLSRRPEGLSLSDLVSAVLAAGYTTTSKCFREVVLSCASCCCKVVRERGRYRLARQ